MRGAAVSIGLVAALLATSNPAGAAAALDQQQVDAGGAPAGAGTAGNNFDFTAAQTFTAGVSGRLTKVELFLERLDATTGALTVELRTVDGGGAPTATVLASSALPAASVSESAGAFVPVSFSVPASVVAGIKYAVVAQTTTGTFYFVATSSGDKYAGGAGFIMSTENPGNWVGFGADLAFKTYVDSAPAFDPACDANGVKTGFNVIKGTDGADNLVGTLGKDLIYGFGGNDVIEGRGGNDLICAGGGNDEVIAGNDGDVVFGGKGNDRIRGGDGHDRLSGGDGNDVIAGGDGRDRLYGDGGSDVLRGNAGRDYLDGGTGADTLRGGDGDDTVKGGPGKDDVAS